MGLVTVNGNKKRGSKPHVVPVSAGMVTGGPRIAPKVRGSLFSHQGVNPRKTDLGSFRFDEEVVEKNACAS